MGAVAIRGDGAVAPFSNGDESFTGEDMLCDSMTLIFLTSSVMVWYGTKIINGRTQSDFRGTEKMT